MEQLNLQDHVMNEQYDQNFCQVQGRDRNAAKIVVFFLKYRVSTKEKFQQIHFILCILVNEL